MIKKYQFFAANQFLNLSDKEVDTPVGGLPVSGNRNAVYYKIASN
jgi:hypothetical protein